MTLTPTPRETALVEALQAVQLWFSDYDYGRDDDGFDDGSAEQELLLAISAALMPYEKEA